MNLDLAVEDLQERLRAGKIYAADKIPWALEHFFKEQNLAHLRELALREVAESVERASARPAAPDAGRASDGRPAPRSRVMVCLSSASPRGASLVRKGSRLAGRLSTDWFVVFVETPRGDAGADRRRGAAASAGEHRSGARAGRRGDAAARARSGRTPSSSSRARTASVTSSSGDPTSRAGSSCSGDRSRCGWCARASGLDVHVVATEDEGGARVKLQTKLLLAQAPLAIALALVGVLSGGGHDAPGRSVAAHPGRQLPQRAGGAADEGGARTHRQHRALRAGRAHGRRGRGDRAPPRERSRTSCAVQEGNVTEAGEGEHHARAAGGLGRVHARRRSLPGARRRRPTASAPTSTSSSRRSARIKQRADEMLAINQDAMVRKSDRVAERGAPPRAHRHERRRAGVRPRAARRHLADPRARSGRSASSARRCGASAKAISRRAPTCAARTRSPRSPRSSTAWRSASNATARARWASCCRRSRRPRRRSTGSPIRCCCWTARGSCRARTRRHPLS